MWNIKEPTHYLRRVGHEVPGVVAVLCVVRQVKSAFEHMFIENALCKFINSKM